MLLYLLIVVLCLVCFHVYIRYSTYGRLINKIPGPTPIPLLGNILLFNKSTEEIWNFLQIQMKIYYPLAKMWLCTKAIVFVQDPDDLKVVLSDKVNICKGYPYKALHLIFDSGLIVSSGETWQKRRKIITPAFHANITKKYIEIISEQGEQMTKSIKAQGDESVQSLVQICSDTTLNIIIEAAMGIKFKVIEDKASEYKHALEYFFAFAAYRMIRPYIQDWMLKFYSGGHKVLTCVQITRSFVNKIIEERREYHNQTKHQSFQDYVDDKDDSDSNVGGLKKRLAMLDLLLLAEKDGLIDAEGIRNEVDTFIAAGYDTTGMAMVYTLMLLAENKEVQELARSEADRILTASGGKITMVEIQQMGYIERCIKESLRLFPSAPNIIRTVMKDVQLKSAMVPIGSEIFIPIFSIHRDPKYWPDPLKYDPDRFLPEEVQKRHPFAYLPFSHGPRNCIGQKFAMAEMKSLTAKVLHNFYLEPVDYTKDFQFTAHVVLLPTIRPKIKFIKIQK